MKQSGFKSCAATGVAAAVMVVASSMASAQSPASPAAANQDATLEEVIVTAERREEDLQRTAVSVSVRSGEELLQQGKFTLQQIVEDVPNIYIAPQRAGADNANDTPAIGITIRGVGSNGRVGGSGPVVPAVALYVDGVNNGLGSNYDLKNVQVLRGPQGTLYGRSATAGVVTIQTNDPVLDRFAGNVAVEAGNYDLLHYTGAVNIPITDVLALRVSGNQYEQKGYYSRLGAQTDTTDGRIKLLFKPNEQLSLLLGYAMQNNKQYSGGNQGTQTADGSVNYDTVLPIGTGKDETRQYWAQLGWDFGPATLTYIPAYRTYEMHALGYGSPAPGIYTTTLQSFPTNSYHTQELRLTSNATSGIRWQGGLFYYDNQQKYNFDLSAPGVQFAPPPTPAIDLFQTDINDRRTRDAGVFGEATFPLADTWRLTTGVRYDYTKVETEKSEVTNLTLAPFFPTLSGVVDRDQGTQDWKNWTYKLRLEHDLTPGNMLYAAASSGFLPGDTFIATDIVNMVLVPSTYEPETLTSFEIGSKNRFLDNRLQVNGDVFYYRYGAFQQPVGRNVGGLIELFTVQSSPARMVGAELETIFQLTPADELSLDVGYINAYYKDKPAEFAEGVSQSHIAGVVPVTITPSYAHTFRLPGDQSIRFQAQALYQSAHDVSAYGSTVVSDGLQRFYRNSDEVTGNVYLTWQHTRYSVTGYVRNVSDERFKTSVSTVSAMTGTAPTALSSPRTYGVVITAGF